MLKSLVHEVALSRQRRAGTAVKNPRKPLEQLSIEDRRLNFDEVEKCLSAEAALEETDRCLRCYRVMLLAVTAEK